ncbi:hypothetical protein [Flexilinea flocculi]|jgi:hypothetical protein|uniref:Uncharacterized protein n=1 Tax=Flexilinea flocculi TaxID=1678840 RepID=A0A0K8PAK5_9CHLR|nr:hypothetical protein [Flexilinea flocculi]GAP39683.1 hypothetical protein ATC1_12217 [Flexilinea flocculi]
MKLKSMILVLLALNLIAIPVFAENDSVTVKPGENYLCGSSFEISFPFEPSTVSMISRDLYKIFNLTEIHAKAEKGERLLQIRLQIRNLTPTIYKGLDPKSFQLAGYVRDRTLTYIPEIMEPYDFGDYETYVWYSPDHNEWSYLPPLRIEDILLVYRVNPILVNWEIHIAPRAKLGTSYDYGSAIYEPIELDPCDKVFRFTSIKNAETGEITKYVIQ